jgi:hypothetical protein
MQIQVNKNIDDYKDDFFKGLTLQQTVSAAATLAAGGGTFALLTYSLKLPATLALYGAFPVAFPIAASGFLKIHGMGIAEWFKGKKRVKDRPLFVYAPCLLGMPDDGPDRPAENKKSQEPILLVNREEQYIRTEQLQKLWQEDGREIPEHAEHEGL